MPRKLLNEAGGILAWAVEGCRLWRTDGLEIPSIIKKATEGYRSEMDVIAQFIEERCQVGNNLKVTGTELYQAYEGWCSQNGESLVSRRKFILRMKENRNFESILIGSKRWQGLKGLSLS